MRASRSICTVGLCYWLLCACANTAVEGPENYVVRADDTLYSIAWRHNLDYRDLARWNHIGGDFRISVGQVLVLGPTRETSPAPAPQRRPAVPEPRPAPETSRAAPPAQERPSGPVRGGAMHDDQSGSSAAQNSQRGASSRNRH